MLGQGHSSTEPWSVWEHLGQSTNEGLGAHEAKGNTARLLRLAYHAKLRLDSEGYQGGGA